MEPLKCGLDEERRRCRTCYGRCQDLLYWRRVAVQRLQWVKSYQEASFNVPDFPWRSCGLVRRLFTASDNSSAASGKPTVYFPRVFIVKVSPIFKVGATHNFWLHPLGCFAKLFVYSLFYYKFLFLSLYCQSLLLLFLGHSYLLTPPSFEWPKRDLTRRLKKDNLGGRVL